MQILIGGEGQILSMSAAVYTVKKVGQKQVLVIGSQYKTAVQTALEHSTEAYKLAGTYITERTKTGKGNSDLRTKVLEHVRAAKKALKGLGGLDVVVNSKLLEKSSNGFLHYKKITPNDAKKLYVRLGGKIATLAPTFGDAGEEPAKEKADSGLLLTSVKKTKSGTKLTFKYQKEKSWSVTAYGHSPEEVGFKFDPGQDIDAMTPFFTDVLKKQGVQVTDVYANPRQDLLTLYVDDEQSVDKALAGIAKMGPQAVKSAGNSAPHAGAKSRPKKAKKGKAGR